MDIAKLHCAMIRGFIDHGYCPSNEELVREFAVSVAEVEDGLRQLEQVHGIVLHPDCAKPWVIHPFCVTPTATWVQGQGRGWWAPCVWCALGVAALVRGDVTIYARLEGETQTIAIPVRDGAPVAPDACCVHFAIRPLHAWNNVHAHCAMVLPFRSDGDARTWASRHRLPFGEVVPLRQVAVMAGNWYGRHADPGWRKWTIAEAQAIFRGAGLCSEFWDLGEGQGRY